VSDRDQTEPTQRRKRKPSLRRLIEAAEKAGKKVTGAVVDGVELRFGESDTGSNTDTEVEDWVDKHAH
jgi:hypothetical protein